MHEGGAITPCVVRWPAKIKAGSWTNSVAHIIDLQPTCMVMAGLDPQKDIPPGKRQLDGESILNIFEGKEFVRKKPLFYEFSNTRAIRDGDWKLVYEKKWSLYNLKNDRTELNDLAAKYPEKVVAMTKSWRQWATRTGVFNLPKRKH